MCRLRIFYLIVKESLPLFADGVKLCAPKNNFAAANCQLCAAGELHSLERRITRFSVQSVGIDYPPAVGVNQHQIGIGARRKRSGGDFEQAAGQTTSAR